MYKGYQKIKKTKQWVSIGYRIQPEGMENIRRVSERLEGYWKCMKDIGKLKKLNAGFQQGIGFSQRVSKILGGYWKCTKGIRKLKKTKCWVSNISDTLLIFSIPY